MQNDIVAIKLSDGSYRIGIVVNNENDPIIAIRVILRGKNVMIEVHSSTMGLLSRDPAAINKDDIAASKLTPTPQPAENQQVDPQEAIENLVTGGNHFGYFVLNLTSRQQVLPLDMENHLKYPHKYIITRYQPRSPSIEDPRIVARTAYSLLLQECNDRDWLDINLSVNAFSQSTLAPPYSRSLDYSNLRYYNYFRDSSNLYIDDRHHPRDYTCLTLTRLMQIKIWNITDAPSLHNFLYLKKQPLKSQMTILYKILRLK